MSRRGVLSQGWLPARADGALEAVLKQGLAMVDDQGPGAERLYWFPCLSVNQAVLGGLNS